MHLYQINLLYPLERNLLSSSRPGLVERFTSCIFRLSAYLWSIFPALCWPSLLHSIFYLAYSVPSKLYLKTGLKLPSRFGGQIRIFLFYQGISVSCFLSDTGNVITLPFLWYIPNTRLLPS